MLSSTRRCQSPTSSWDGLCHGVREEVPNQPPALTIWSPPSSLRGLQISTYDAAGPAPNRRQLLCSAVPPRGVWICGSILPSFRKPLPPCLLLHPLSALVLTGCHHYQHLGLRLRFCSTSSKSSIHRNIFRWVHRNFCSLSTVMVHAALP